jgi:hypothetical protein
MVPIPLNCTGWLPAGLPLLARSMLFLAKKKKKKKNKINNVLAGYQSRGLGKFLAWLEQMVLASPLLSKFWLENSNLIWVDSM